MAATIREVLVKKYEEDITKLEEFLSDGKAKDYADYKNVSGQIRGLRTAVSTTNDLLRERDDDDE